MVDWTAMSYITDMVIICSLSEDAAMERVNAWCVEHDRRYGDQRFARLDSDAAGGAKVFTAQVWAMAGNYFPWEDLADAFPSFGWRSPSCVVLVVDAEGFPGVQVFRADQRAITTDLERW